MNAPRCLLSSHGQDWIRLNIFYCIKKQKFQTQVNTTLERHLPVKLAEANSRYLKVKVLPKAPISPS